MSLLIVVLGPEELGELTLREYDTLRERHIVYFEDPGHPLRARLRTESIETAEVIDDIDPDDGTAALVVAPGSPRARLLAEAGATVAVGPAIPPDAVTAAQGAPIARRAAKSMSELALVMARLRGPGGCPWDIEQTHGSLQVHLLEEAHEVLEAIDSNKLGAELEEELGDVLLQVVFHAQMAADDDRFDLDGVARRVVAKLIHRHPHVFSDTEVSGAAEVVSNWEALKAEEKEDRTGPFDGIPAGLPALLAAQKTQKRAAALGFDGDPTGAQRELSRAIADGEFGRALFWVVALARAAGVEPEGALRRATTQFQESF